LKEIHKAEGRAMSDKEMVIEAIRQLPDVVTIDEIAEEVAILAAIQKGERDVNAGCVVSHDQVKERAVSRVSHASR
jgi:predicted transcriptional regulator